MTTILTPFHRTRCGGAEKPEICIGMLAGRHRTETDDEVEIAPLRIEILTPSRAEQGQRINAISAAKLRESLEPARPEVLLQKTWVHCTAEKGLVADPHVLLFLAEKRRLSSFSRYFILESDPSLPYWIVVSVSINRGSSP